MVLFGSNFDLDVALHLCLRPGLEMYSWEIITSDTVYPKKYAHGFCFAVLFCRYTLTEFPISIRLTSLALWQYNDCPSASKATLMNMDKYFMWIHYERLHNHKKAKHNKTVCIFLGIYCIGEKLLHQICRAGRGGKLTSVKSNRTIWTRLHKALRLNDHDDCDISSVWSTEIWYKHMCLVANHY